jgi:hypothetical protein
MPVFVAMVIIVGISLTTGIVIINEYSAKFVTPAKLGNLSKSIQNAFQVSMLHSFLSSKLGLKIPRIDCPSLY